ncbi:MAG: hypothetical protein DRO93_08005 [Candidatus Thorarchaeota archaeon]|nr:MAG: hypothetical protein DRO93_08005 [Candidatus Thorarchaeota archaeon]
MAHQSVCVTLANAYQVKRERQDRKGIVCSNEWYIILHGHEGASALIALLLLVGLVAAIPTYYAELIRH